ncbi:RelA/SpoT family protein [Streptomyces radicis]|uniref:Bifunctional (P)ppGpp synthetase/guanosine-3',5'-bis(Diphosphate) 3'-pyrophosphohydrolase n=1 Tax=Streptomyces radicis TaxID=1750517 RepID=A0A3A9W1T7_9ACTN|nr:HD domain-containing protein [Streptomyces radicis]RKN06819.1 bifunctional (p)ppGpp synthetase/guanosine-3',5'-bis(diphosphate) 3'-pyrophosphohydrolase [Streptomyces radicis]RKN19437.1 bifunctional (p)ppGpp synthetase/guanosine-3',5'-bis(diphosphate) 3'-pyrophosphohydrolase [Streptomyces radicis]
MSAEATTPGDAARERRGHRRDVLRLRQLGRAAVIRSTVRHRLPDAIEHVAQAHRRHHPRADLDALRRAYLLAESAHRGQFRKSGEPYITHPLAVTLILAELGAETTTLTASLLHDTVEDTEVTLDQVRADFGDEVGHLVDGVTKLEKVEYGAAAEPETFRKMLVATGSDVRVMSIKLADRLHNMRTLGVMRPEKQARIARVTRDVLIPLAERLGVQAVKSELEDLVFAILHPEEHARAQELIRRHSAGPDPLAEAADAVREVLREAGIAAQVVTRPRHVLSVHRVRLKRGEPGPYDYGRLLILVAENADCYAALGELHTCFTPVVSEFKDFIAVPKFNLYQSLHTAFAFGGGRIAEVLLRTHAMHRVAEAGVIVLGDPHRAGEGDAGAEEERVDPTRPGWLSRLLDWQRQTPDPDTFWTALRDELAKDREITVFGEEPGSGPLQLPVGATCVDAAYARHGDAAHACLGVRVNGRLATLRTVLHDGDTVHLLLAPDGSSGPSPEWLEHATTPAARIPIRRWLDSREASGGDAGPEPAPHHGQAAGALAPVARRAAADPADRAAAIVADVPGAPVRLARCCTPVPPDGVRGFTVRGGAVTVHREDCPTAVRMTAAGRRPLPVTWRSESIGCRVTLHAEALGRPELLADLTEALAAHGAAVLAAEVEPPREHRVRHTYTLRLPDSAGLPRLMRAMRRVPGVYDVTRAARLQS